MRRPGSDYPNVRPSGLLFGSLQSRLFVREAELTTRRRFSGISLFSRLLSLHEERIPVEDFFTEILVHLLNVDHRVLAAWCASMGLAVDVDIASVEAQLEWVDEAHHRVVRPDILVRRREDGDVLIAIESKITAKVDPHQLRHYADALQVLGGTQPKTLILVTRDPSIPIPNVVLDDAGECRVRFVQTRWCSFYRVLRACEQTTLVGEVQSYMEEQGLAFDPQAVRATSLLHGPSTARLGLMQQLLAEVQEPFQEATGQRARWELSTHAHVDGLTADCSVCCDFGRRGVGLAIGFFHDEQLSPGHLMYGLIVKFRRGAAAPDRESFQRWAEWARATRDDDDRAADAGRTRLLEEGVDQWLSSRFGATGSQLARRVAIQEVTSEFAEYDQRWSAVRAMHALARQTGWIGYKVRWVVTATYERRRKTHKHSDLRLVLLGPKAEPTHVFDYYRVMRWRDVENTGADATADDLRPFLKEVVAEVRRLGVEYSHLFGGCADEAGHAEERPASNAGDGMASAERAQEPGPEMKPLL